MSTELVFIDDLYDHQKQAVAQLHEWETHPLHDVKGGILGFKMGLGKTRTMLELVFQNKKEGQPILVVCNKSNIQVWKNEIEKFYFDELTYFILHSSFTKKTDTISQEEIEKYDVIITTYEVVRKQFGLADPQCYIVRENNFMPLEKNLYKKSRIPEKYKIVTVQKNPELTVTKYTPIYSRKWSRIITDESQKFTGINTKLCKAMIALVADSYFCLSGTPIVNYSTDLYSLFRFMGLFCLPKDWKQRYYSAMQLETRILIKDYDDTNIILPEIKMVNVQVDLSPIEKEMYNACVTMLKEAYAKFIRGLETFAAPLAMFTRLRQICVCSYILTEESKRTKKSLKLQDLEALKSLVKIEMQNEEKKTGFFLEEKYNDYIKDKDNIPEYTKIKKCLELVTDILNKNDSSKVLIFSSFVCVLDVLKKLFKSRDIKCLLLDGSVNINNREDMVKMINSRDEYRILLSSYKAGGVGLNLTGADYVILIEPWWNSATEEQAICRSHRIGQTKPVTVYSLIATPSFETYLIKVQQRKNAMAKEYISNYQQKYDRLSDSSVAKDLIRYIISSGSDYYIS